MLRFAVTLYQGKGTAALATLDEIRGEGAKAVGIHMAIASDGRYCGYDSGNVWKEASVTAEALIAIGQRRNRQLSLGEGASCFDFVLPCSRAISSAIYVLDDVSCPATVAKVARMRWSSAPSMTVEMPYRL